MRRGHGGLGGAWSGRPFPGRDLRLAALPTLPPGCRRHEPGRDSFLRSPGGRPTLTCPAEAARGTQVCCRLGIGQSSGSTAVVCLEVYDPAGKLRSYYSGSRLLPPSQAQAEVSFRLAPNDPPGEWLLKAVDVVGGRSAQCRLIVRDN